MQHVGPRADTLCCVSTNAGGARDIARRDRVPPRANFSDSLKTPAT
jgi:hypothetical protein